MKPVRTRIKICGLKEIEHIDAAVHAGVDALGLNFYAPSVRAIDVATAQRLRKQIPAFVSTVALFVNHDAAFVNEVIAAVKPDLLQFHGAESPEFCAQFSRPYLKAIAMKTGVNLLDLRRQYAHAAAILVDTPSAGHGGSGEVFDWSLLTIDGNAGPLVLSGGLNAANVREAIARVRPYAVDVSSGVELEKGKKDSRRVVEFIQAVHEADASLL